MGPVHPRTVHYTELPPARPGEPLYEEYETYRREAGRLLAEGNEGKWIVIKGEEIIGIWETEEEAYGVRLKKYLRQDCLMTQILTREPIYRCTWRKTCRT